MTTDPGGRSASERPTTYIRFDGWLGHVETAFNLFAAFSILALMLLAVAQVLGRFFFNTPIPGFIDPLLRAPHIQGMQRGGFNRGGVQLLFGNLKVYRLAVVSLRYRQFSHGRRFSLTRRRDFTEQTTIFA